MKYLISFITLFGIWCYITEDIEMKPLSKQQKQVTPNDLTKQKHKTEYLCRDLDNKNQVVWRPCKK